ncbi:MAG: polynucleotide adenylyltransferase PcnB [bacterium]|nr:polynucleotide adenylyltransferase PcnB [bacterium]
MSSSAGLAQALCAYGPEQAEGTYNGGGVEATDEMEPRILERSKHPVSRRQISTDAVKVLYRLHRSGYKAYLVGGGVRDLMLGRRPKDFDVSTDARPNELRRLFRNGRIIGRRFRLAHIIFRDGVIEVATFRRAPDPNDQRGGPGDLLITSDNTFGTPREDAFRRDFTINALFYNIADYSVIDYVGGIDDLRNKLVRVIGDPGVRFREDPVRMLRACEFAGRLGFTIETATQEAIQEHRDELRKAAPPRVTEELLQLLRSGRAGASVQWMLELGLLEVLLPEALAMIGASRRGAGEFSNVLPTLDALVAEKREVPDQVLLDTILLPQIMLRRFERETATGLFMRPEEFHEMIDETLEPFLDRFAVPKLKKAAMAQALEGFHRMCEGRWTRNRRARFVNKPYFDDALLLFEILVRSTGEGHQVLDQWQAEARQRQRRPEPYVEAKKRRRRRRR